MSAAPILSRQRNAIHAIRNKLNLDDASYRGLLQGFGAATSNDLSEADAQAVIARLRAMEGSASEVTRSPMSRATGKYAPKLQAMWLALYNLGVIDDRKDSALHAFMKGQTGIEHTRFLQSWEDARSVIEPLKKMLVRAGVEWAPNATKSDMKRAVLRAQWRRCVALGVFSPSRVADDCDGLVDFVSHVARGRTRLIGALEDASVTAAELNAGSAALGRKLRKAQAKAKPAEARHVA